MTAVRLRGPDVSIDDLAGACGVSKPVLYDEFGDKRGIADAVAVAMARDVEAQVLGQLADLGTIDIDAIIRELLTALIDLVDDEPELYEFVVRSIRASDRGFLDNALVRTLHERLGAYVGLLAPGAPPDRVAVLVDGVYGFVFAAIESWQTHRAPDRDALLTTLIDVIRAGAAAAAAP